jgi:hypothetical protein
MGLAYRPVCVVANGNTKRTVGLIDNGADETVISPMLAEALGCKLSGKFIGVSITRHEMIGKYTVVECIRDEWYGNSVTDYRVGVVKEPFIEEGDDGIHIILGADFLQDSNHKLDFRKSEEG